MAQNLFSDLLGELPENLAAEALTQSPATLCRKNSSQLSGAAESGVSDGIPSVMNAPDLAQFLGVSETKARTVGVKLDGRGRFDVRATVRTYGDRLREQAGRAGRPSESGDTYALKVEKLRLTAAQREAQEMKNAVARGELVSAEDAQRTWTSILVDVRAALLAIPSRLPELTPEQKVQVDLELRLALERLANG